jgi:monoterpene epsilon-lactone hydrolase
MTGRRPRRGLRVPPAIMRPVVGQLGGRALDPARPWSVQRTRLDQVTRIALLPRHTTVSEQTIAGLRAEVVSSRPPSSGLTVIHFHGGGYCLGSAVMARSWAAHLSAQTGCRVILPEYRLAPEHPYPAALQDARAVMKALSGPDPVVVSGDSAGGGLALALALAMREEGQGPPAGAILLSPWLDLGRDRRADPHLVRRDVLLDPDWLDACARAYAGPSAWADPLVSPLHATRPGRRTAGGLRFGRRGRRDLHPVAAHVARLRAPTRFAHRRRQRAGPGILVRPQGSRQPVTPSRA